MKARGEAGGGGFGEFAEHRPGDRAARAETFHCPVECGNVAESGQRQVGSAFERLPVEQRQQMGRAESAPDCEQQFDFWIEPEGGEVFRAFFGARREVGDGGGAVDVASELQLFSRRAQKSDAGVEFVRLEFSGRGDDSDGVKRIVHGWIPPDSDVAAVSAIVARRAAVAFLEQA